MAMGVSAEPGVFETARPWLCQSVGVTVPRCSNTACVGRLQTVALIAHYELIYQPGKLLDFVSCSVLCGPTGHFNTRAACQFYHHLCCWCSQKCHGEVQWSLEQLGC